MRNRFGRNRLGNENAQMRIRISDSLFVTFLSALTIVLYEKYSVFTAVIGSLIAAFWIGLDRHLRWALVFGVSIGFSIVAYSYCETWFYFLHHDESTSPALQNGVFIDLIFVPVLQMIYITYLTTISAFSGWLCGHGVRRVLSPFISKT